MLSEDVQVAENQQKPHIIIGFRTKIWKGRKTATKTLKKEIRFILEKHGNLWQLSYPAKTGTGRQCSISRSYIALLMREMGLRSVAKEENSWRQRLRTHLPCRGHKTLTETFGTMQLGKNGSQILHISVVGDQWNY